jgi:putative membrane protein
MPSPAQAVLLSWSIPPAASFALALTALLYIRGWLLMRRAGVPFLPLWRAASFLLGLLSLWVALASPLDTFSGFVLTAHMLQHMTLMMIAPPLILMGAPLIPLVRGLPVFAAREFAGPFLNWRIATRLGNALIHPAVALIIMGAAMFAWHTPRLYELALASGSWHEVEHACFFLASLIFWWPVIQPWPSHTHRPRWILVPYLLIGDLQNTVLSAILFFSDRLIYPSYGTTPRLFGFSALADQAAAGAIMWVVGSTAFLIPATVIAVQLLASRRTSASHIAVRAPQSQALDATFAAAQRLPSPLKFLQSRFHGKTIEAATFVVLFVATGFCLAVLGSSGSDDDDQALRLSQTTGPFVVSVFALPGSLETGRSEFNVLIQDRDTLQVV